MALVSLSVKRHLGEEFPVVPPSPPQSPIFCSSPIRLLSSLRTSSLSENQPKKRRKQEHPLFLTDSQFSTEGVSESSADEMEKVKESQLESVVTPSHDIDRDQAEDIKDVHSSYPKDGERLRRDRAGADVRKDVEANAGRVLEEKLAVLRSHETSLSNVPLMLLSQVASDMIGHLSSSSSSPSKPQQEIPTAFLKQDEKFVGESHASSDGELPSGDLVPDGVAEVCPDCKKVFKRKIYLQRHMAREHWSLAKVFKCEKCAYETKHQSNLLVHRRTHTGERPYHCGACGQRYTQGHLLKAHIRSRHGADMRFYNMDKRTDGTRCRRLLDAKLIGGGKEDRIRFLLQAAEAACRRPSPPSPPRSMFGAMMPPSLNQYMNVLSCLPNGLRPVLWPSLSGGLLGTSGGFPSSSLQNGIPSHAALLSSLAAPLSLASGMMASNGHPSKASGSLLSSMLASPSYAASLKAIKSENFADDRISSKALCSSPGRGTAQNTFAVPVELSMIPEDLTTTRRAAAPSEAAASAEKTPSCQSKDKEIGLNLQGLGTFPLSTSLSLGHSGCGGLITASGLTSQYVSRNQDSTMLSSGVDMKLPPDDCARIFPSHNENTRQKLGPTKTSSHEPGCEDIMMNFSSNKLNVISRLFPESSQSRHMSFDISDTSQDQATSAQWNQISASHLQLGKGAAVQSIIEGPVGHESPAKAMVEEPGAELTMDAGCSKTVPSGHSKCPESSVASCQEACCPYLKKLKDLRRNVYHMLCVFTPYLGVANINDYEADSIDEFLHEVIYSKLDDTE